MKPAKVRIFAFLICFLPIQLLSQTDEANHQKYWYYRTRLTNDFMKVGLEAGESIPFNQRGQYATDFYVENVALLAGDATSTIGYYIAVLATEYQLLASNGQDVTKTKHELFCALNAINRLDYKAEGLYEPGTEALNGFFIRDDIPTTFITDQAYYDHFNYYSAGLGNNKKSRGFCSWFQTGANLISSSWIGHIKEQRDIAMSQDQVYCVLLGLSCVSRFVPTSETDGENIFGYGSGERSLTAEARNIAGRIIDFMRNSKNLTGEPCSITVATGWNLKNPVNCQEVPTGNDTHTFSYALSEAECFIRYPGLYSKNGHRRTNIPASCSGKGFHNTFSKTIGFELWNGSAKSLLYLPSSPHYGADSRGQIANMSAICNCVYGTAADGIVQRATGAFRNVKGLNWIGQTANYAWMGVSTAVSTFIPFAYMNQTRMAINMNSYINGTGSPKNQLGDPGCPFDHAPLARSVLHGTKYDKNKKYSIKYLLDVAPCDNIYNLSNLNYGHYEWSSDNRLDRPDRRGWYGNNYDSGNPFSSEQWRPPAGEYHGIDYMLYHNLWYIFKLQKGTKQAIEDLSDVNINSGGIAFNKSVGAFETISATNVKIEKSGSELNWRSGKTIYFGPGTELSGNFHAYIKRYICATDIDNPTNKGAELTLPERDTLAIKGPVFEEELHVVPNPSEAKFEIYYNIQSNEKIYFKVFDLQGNLVLALPDAHRTDTGLILDLGGVSDGVYILKGYTSFGRLMTKKLIKL